MHFDWLDPNFVTLDDIDVKLDLTVSRTYFEACK